MQTKIGKFTFSVPEGHPQAGEKIEKSFEYKVCDTEAEALHVMKFDSDGKERSKPMSLVAMLNDVLKANARSNAYQSALLPFKPSEVSAEEIQERMVRDYIRLGIPEEVARKQVAALLAATKTEAPATPEVPSETPSDEIETIQG